MRSLDIQLGGVAFSSEDKRVIIHLARELTGTQVTDDRHGLIFLNVSSRIQETRCDSLTSYLVFVHANECEIPHLLSALTIRTTGWFREPGTFEVFQKIVSEFAQNNPKARFNVLSLGCSSGEEVFSYAFILEEVRVAFPGFSYSVTGIDIDPISLSQGRSGRYGKVRPDLVDERWRPYILRRLTPDSSLSIDPAIMSSVQFRSANILHLQPAADEYDFISCRNILIYFDSAQIDLILNKVLHMLRPGGHFCTGVSETGAVTRAEFKSIGTTIFRVGRIPQVGSMAPKIRLREIVRSSSTNQSDAALSVGSVVIVDDEIELLSVYESCLKSSFKSVSSASRFDDALRELRLHRDALLVVDYRLDQGKTGLDLVREGRRQGFVGDFLILSGFADKDMAMKAHELGCKDVLLKPCQPDELITAVRRWGTIPNDPSVFAQRPDVIAFGSSTGGTEILIRILENIPKPCPPVVVVQHIVAEFAADFASRLAERSGLTLGRMQDGESLRGDHLYMALGDYHIMIRRSGGLLRLGVSHADPVSSHRPSVDVLFNSLAEQRIKTLAVILTGMGRDGADGMAKVHKQGGFTIAQDEASSIVFGMPGEAIKLGVVDFVGNPREIQAKIHDSIKHKKKAVS